MLKCLELKSECVNLTQHVVFALELAIRHSASVITHGAQPEPREFQPGPSTGAPEAATPVAANRGAC